jgi:DNA mismatch repair protein MutL
VRWAHEALVAQAELGADSEERAGAVPAVTTEQPDQAALPMHERLPALRALGQVDATYLVAEAPDGLYLVDQHAAHERVLYEQVLAARAAGQPAVQPLLTAVVVPLGAAQSALVAEQAEVLAAVGFEVAATDGAAVLLRAVPAALARHDPARALQGYLERFEREERLSGPDRAAASLACRAAVMAGDRLDTEHQRSLLRALEATEAPQTCPHGRPTMLHLSNDALARSFGRK